MAEAKKGMTPIIWGWLVLSTLLNMSGIASIVDGFVTWAKFFQDIVDLYRALIREPLSWLVHLVWPNGWPKIPSWVFDLLVIWSGVWIAINVHALQVEGQSLLRSAIKEDGIPFLFLVFLIGPGFVLWHSLSRNPADRREGRRILLYYLAIVVAFIVILFLNWQLKRVAAP